MKYLFENIQTVDALLNAREKTILLTDFDGTLTPIQKHPDLAALSEEMRQILIKFSQNKAIFLGIITGRSLKQIKKLVNIPEILYVANHGIELEGPGIHYVSKEARKARYILWHIYMRLFKSLKHIEGMHIEDKGFSISLHYRAVKKKSDVEFVTSTLRDITKPFLDRNMILLSEGKMVYEIRPPGKWNKATAIQWLLTDYFPLKFNEDVLIIYLGDDKADIEVFDSLRGKGLTIFVGNPSDTAAANYYVNSPEEVKAFLEHLCTQKQESCNEYHQ